MRFPSWHYSQIRGLFFQYKEGTCILADVSFWRAAEVGVLLKWAKQAPVVRDKESR